MLRCRNANSYLTLLARNPVNNACWELLRRLLFPNSFDKISQRIFLLRIIRKAIFFSMISIGNSLPIKMNWIFYRQNYLKGHILK